MFSAPVKLFGVAASPAELEKLLAMAGVLVLADTIATYWTDTDRVAALDWACGRIAAKECQEAILIPAMPEVLKPFWELAKAASNLTP